MPLTTTAIADHAWPVNPAHDPPQPSRGILLFTFTECVAPNQSVANARSWPGRVKAVFKLAAVYRSFKAGRQGKF